MGQRPMDVAERLTPRGLFRGVDQETADLTDHTTVRRWLRELRPDIDQQVFIHRSWGTLAAVADGRNPVSVVRSDGEHSWFAGPPGAAEDHHLTPDQIEHVMLDALTSTAPPSWPAWHRLT